MATINISLEQLLAELTDACKAGSMPDHKGTIVQKAHEIIRAVSTPADFMHSIFANTFTMLSLRTLIHFNVLQTLSSHDEAVSLSTLASLSNFEESLLERLLAPLVAAGVVTLIVSDTSVKSYRQTPFSKAFTGETLPALLFPIIYDYNVAGMLRLWEWLEEKHGRKGDLLSEPDDMTHAPISWVNGMEGKTVFEVFESKGVAGSFNRAMTAMNSFHRFPPPEQGFFDFGKLVPNGDVERAVLVDIGGGYGQSLKTILASSALLHSPAKQGQIILQDLEPVIAKVPEAGLLPDGVKAMVHDMFSVQPIRHARGYFMRRILHDWSDKVCLQILGHIVDAMAEDSVVLINELVVPEKVDASCAELLNMDMSIMAIGGKQRTERHWRELLDGAGLVLAKVWTGYGNDRLVEARLKNDGNSQV